MGGVQPRGPEHQGSQNILLHIRLDRVKPFQLPKEADGPPSAPVILHDMRLPPLMLLRMLQPIGACPECIPTRRPWSIDLGSAP